MGYRSHLQSLPKAETSGTTHMRDLGLLGTGWERKTCINRGGSHTGVAGTEFRHISSSLELSVKPPAGFPSPPWCFVPFCQGCLVVCSPLRSLLSPTDCYPQIAARAERRHQPDSSLPLLAMLMLGPAERAVQVPPSPRLSATSLPELPGTAQTQLPFPACSPAPSAMLPVHRLCFHISEPDLEVCVEILPLHLEHGHVPAAREL